MSDDAMLCLCFHVTRRKVKNYLRIRRPRFASALSECGGAGTGCGWCRPYLQQMFQAWQTGQASGDGSLSDGCPSGTASVDVELPAPEQYAAAREVYRRARQQTERHPDDLTAPGPVSEHASDHASDDDGNDMSAT